jgi:hypothetical protein
MKWFIASQLAVGAALFAIAGTRSATAGICAPVPPLETAVAETPFILIGSVTEVKILPATEPNPPAPNTHYPHFTVAVEEYLKGSGPSALTIRERSIFYTIDANGNPVPAGGASIHFFSEGSVGKRYILFLPRLDLPDGPACTWSGELNTTNEQLIQDIRRILAATPTPAPTPGGLPRSGGANGSEPSGPLLAIATALGAATLGAGLFWRGRTRLRD